MFFNNGNNKEGAYKEILFIKIEIHYDVCIFNLTQLYPVGNLQMILVKKIAKKFVTVPVFFWYFS